MLNSGRVRANELTYGAVMAKLHNHGMYNITEEVFEKLKKSDVPLNSFFCKVMLDTYLHLKKVCCTWMCGLMVNFMWR